MSKLDNDKFKALLKSVNTDFDKDLMWNEIDSQMVDLDKERKRKGFFWWFSLGLFFLVFTVIGWYTWTSESDIKRYSEVELDSEKNKNDITLQASINSTSKVSKEQKQIERTTKSISSNEDIFQIDKAVINRIDYSDHSKKSEFIRKRASDLQVMDPINEVSVRNSNKLVERVEEKDFENKSFFEESYLVSIAAKALDNETFSLDVKGMDQHILFSENKLKEPKALQSKSAVLINLHAGYLNSNKTVSDVARSSFAEAVDYSNEALYEIGVNTAYLIPITSSFSIVPGLHYNAKTEVFRGQEVLVDVEVVDSDSASYFVFENGVKAFYAGDIDQTDYRFRRVQNYNKIHALGVHLSARYTRQFGLWNIFISEGVAFENTFNVKGKNWAKNSNIIHFNEGKVSHRNSMVNVLQVGIERKITESIFLTAGFQNRWDLLSRFQFQEVRHNYQSYNAQVGMKFLVF